MTASEPPSYLKMRAFDSLKISMAGLLVMTGLWVAITYSRMVEPIFLPGPLAVLKAFFGLMITGDLGSAVWRSFSRILLAMALASLFGLPLGILMGSVPLANSMLAPAVQPLRYLPITALLPLCILWFGIGERMKIFFLFIGIVGYLVPLVRDAIRDVREEYVQVARNFGWSRWAITWKVLVPAAWPQIFNGIIVCNGLGWTYVILAEIINPQNGLGYLMSIAGRLQRSDQAFAGLLVIAAVALASDRVLTLLRRRFWTW